MHRNERRALLVGLMIWSACSGPHPSGDGRTAQPPPPPVKPGMKANADVPAGPMVSTESAGPSTDPGAAPSSPVAQRGMGAFVCMGSASVPPPPRRLVRLTDVQYRNVIAALFKGRRSSTNNYLPVPAGIIIPIEPLGDVYRFGTDGGNHSLSDIEFRRSLVATEDIARRLVTTTKATSGNCLGGAGVTALAEACLETLIKDKGGMLFGRPPVADEIAAYGKMVRDALPSLGRDEALVLGFQAMLSAPQFLFRAEIGDPIGGTSGTARLTSYEVASVLAYTLTDGPADQELWEAAGRGDLNVPEKIATQLDRLFRTSSQTGPPSSGTTPAPTTPLASGLREFVVEYFRLHHVLDVPKAEEERCRFGRPRVLKDARLVVGDILGSNAKTDFLKTLLTSPVQYYGCDTSRIFGVNKEPTVEDTRFIPPSGTRAGLLTNPAFLAAHSGFDETFPVKRGRFVNESLLCRDIPEVPIGVIPQLPPRTPSTQMKDRLALHATEPSCSTCHKLMDPIGLSLEIYDQYGKHRSLEAGKPILAGGVLTGTDVDGPYKDAVELSERLAGSLQVQQCFVRHGFRYFMGRHEDAFDSCTLEAAAKAYVAGSGNYHAFVTALFTSPSFLHRSF